jgi:hypothetical protein
VGTASLSVQFARTPPVGFEAILASGGGGFGKPRPSLGHVRTNTHGRICSIVCAAPPPPPLVLSLLRSCFQDPGARADWWGYSSAASRHLPTPEQGPVW